MTISESGRTIVSIKNFSSDNFVLCPNFKDIESSEMSLFHFKCPGSYLPDICIVRYFHRLNIRDSLKKFLGGYYHYVFINVYCLRKICNVKGYTTICLSRTNFLSVGLSSLYLLFKQDHYYKNSF